MAMEFWRRERMLMWDQRPLDPDALRILHANLWNLYESSVGPETSSTPTSESSCAIDGPKKSG
jgi:hypothetical protein